MTVDATRTRPTSDDVVQRVPLPLAARELVVESVEELSPSLRRVHLTGPDLLGFAAHGPADHVKVFFPADDGVLHLPNVSGGRWLDHGDPRFTYRDYTVRTFDGERLTLDMVVHAHGPAGRWAAGARPGLSLGVLGPRGSILPPLDRTHYLLAADETGLPALLNWLDRLPATARVHAVVEVDSPAHHVDLPALARVDVTWVYRDGAEPGTTTLLVDAVRTVHEGLSDVPAAQRWSWAAAETSAVRAIRGLLTADGHDRTSFAMTGYWRRGTANFDHHAPDA